MNRHFSILILLIFLSQINNAFTQEIDAKESSIHFVTTNLGYEIEGRFRTFSGTASFSPQKPEESSFQVSIPVKSINTANRMRDEHLQEEEFFHVASYPNIIFSSQKVEKKDDQWIVSGMLQMKGTNKQISIPFSYEDASFSGEFSLDRNDYNIGSDGFLDTIGDVITIRINCRLKTNE